MARDVHDADGVTWACVQALAGLAQSAAKTAAAQVPGTEDCYYVVCTPSGGAQSVRLELPEAWETDLDDDAVLAAIATQRAQDA
jgi:hypothetical protein